jgi:hypothetical protein
MPSIKQATPQISVRLYKTISRKTIDGSTAVSARYAGKDEFIDLAPFLGDGGSVRTTKSVREPAGGFSIIFMDKAQGSANLETVYGLIEPMDVIEIRMWSGVGARPLAGEYPIIMRGFVSDINRPQTMSAEGKPIRSVVVSGQDYGKVWQTFQVLHIPAYTQGKALLTSFALSEIYDFKAVTAMPAGEFVRTMIEKIINPYISGFLPASEVTRSIPKTIQTGESISVKHGTVGIHFQSMQGSVYDILKSHTDVGHWNELYVEDREDGVHCVYRAAPYLKLSGKSTAERKIHDDAPDPVYVTIPDSDIESVSVSRSDSAVANWYWVNNQRFDLIDDMTRRLFALQEGNDSVSTGDYPNTAVKYYGVRPMYADTQLAEDTIKNTNAGAPTEPQEKRDEKQLSWVEKRRLQLIETYKDSVVLERGSARIKGGPMRADGKEAMKAGDYARFQVGRYTWDAYVVQIDHEFVPYQGYTTNLVLERGEGFAKRVTGNNGSPWLTEQATRMGAL